LAAPKHSVSLGVEKVGEKNKSAENQGEVRRWTIWLDTVDATETLSLATGKNTRGLKCPFLCQFYSHHIGPI
jgi:hypothetical protein